MERLIRLNEVQYAATEAQAERLKEQGFRVEALPEGRQVMLSDVRMLIKASVGYEVQDIDLPVLSYIYSDVEQHIKNDCNVAEIPEGLRAVLDELTAGKFLALQKGVILGTEGTEVVKSIREGDTTVELGGTSTEQRYDALVRVLTKERDFAGYRRFRW